MRGLQTASSWRLAAGGWRLAAGGWRLTADVSDVSCKQKTHTTHKG